MADKNTQAFFDHSQAAFFKFLEEGTKMSADMEQANPEASALVDNILELGLRIRTLRQYCLNGSVSHEGMMVVNAERVIQILDGA